MTSFQLDLLDYGNETSFMSENNTKQNNEIHYYQNSASGKVQLVFTRNLP